MTRRYRYLGDRATRGLRPELAGATCIAVLNDRGKCVCGRRGNMLVRFEASGEVHVVLRRQLRKAVAA